MSSVFGQADYILWTFRAPAAAEAAKRMEAIYELSVITGQTQDELLEELRESPESFWQFVERKKADKVVNLGNYLRGY